MCCGFALLSIKFVHRLERQAINRKMNMETKQAILSTLQDSGPADIRELWDTLSVTRPNVSHEHVCMELHTLIRECKVEVNMGTYSAVPV